MTRNAAGPREWVLLSGVVAVIVTTADAILLQRKHNLFTGGFLSVDHLQGAGQIVWFLSTSLLADAAVGGFLVAVGLTIARRFRLARPARWLAALATALIPLGLADVASYRLLDYLGDAFDFDLMFGLVDRDPTEIIAVAAGPLAPFAIVCVTCAVVAVAVVALVQRRWPDDGGSGTLEGPAFRAVSCAVVALGLAFIATTASRISRDSLDNGLRRKPSGMVLGWPAGTVTDFDRDGYGLLSRVRDTAPFDRAIHPYAVDTPGNGVDEDGVGGDLPAEFPLYREPIRPAPRFGTHPDVVLVLLETFRADVVGSVAGGRPVTPVFDRLAATGLKSEQAWSHNGYTVQSRFHVFSGSLANLRGGTSLIDDFLANGYEVAYFSAQDESFGANGLSYGYERASLFFDARQDRDGRYSFFSTPGSLALPYNSIVKRVQEFTQRRDRSRPLLLYVNFHDTHFPYTHRFIEPIIEAPTLSRAEITPNRRDELRLMYLNTAANVDKGVGEVVQAVRSSTGREPGVIVTADHGESLFEDGYLGHGFTLNEAQTRVPLIVAGLPMTVTEPWGQVYLRDSLAMALSDRPTVSGVPERSANAAPLFQYIGHLQNPVQIAFVLPEGRVLYDFRTRRFSTIDGQTEDAETLTGESRRLFLNLLHHWEGMMLAAAREQARN